MVAKCILIQNHQFCLDVVGGEDKVAYSIQRKTNRLQEIAWSLKGQNDIAQSTPQKG